jgi:hypothetical protein
MGTFDFHDTLGRLDRGDPKQKRQEYGDELLHDNSPHDGQDKT